MLDRIVKLEEITLEHDRSLTAVVHDLYGNGKEGAVRRLDEIEKKVNSISAKWLLIMWLLGAVGDAIVRGAIVYLAK